MENTHTFPKPTPAELELLHNYAAFGQNDLIIKFFTTFGTSYVDHPDAYGWTPLMLATCNSGTDTLTILLEHGASLEKKSDAGNTATMIANQNNRPHIVSFLMNWPLEQQRKQELEEKKKLEEQKRIQYEQRQQQQKDIAASRIDTLKKKKISVLKRSS